MAPLSAISIIPPVSPDALSLALLTFLLGMKHGFDADHLATIDGLTRYNLRTRPALARYCGTLFSLGHGGVVMIIALSVSTLAGQWEVPEWFELLGALISIAFLVGLGSLNLAAVLRAAPDEVVPPVGIKGRLLERLFAHLPEGHPAQTSHPLLIALVGSLFALSFDTLSQATFFALSATQLGDQQHSQYAFGLALLFTLGMLLTDGINGLWIARLIARADQIALIASRVMGLVVAGVSLLVAAFGLAKLLSPAIDAWAEGKELALGLLLVTIITTSFFWSVRMTRPPHSASH